MDLDEVLAVTFSLVAPHLTERQRRLLLGATARSLGYGGVSRVARLAEASRPTVRRGAAELDQPPDPRGRIRQHEGPKRRRDTDPGLLQALDRLVDPDTRGDAQSPLRWTCKSTRELAEALTAQGHPVSDDTVGRLLREQGYRLQRTAKTLEGAEHVDRDAQFRCLNEQAKQHLAAGQPVVSVDTKKKELVGQFANGGAEWQPSGQPEQVNVHDFPDPTLGKAIPYGVYDLGHNTGWVGVGTDHDTAAFAVQTLRRWWQQVGSLAYPQAERLLVCADAGGSNGYRVRAWKTELARLAAETGDHRLPPAARDLQVEPDRAPAVQRDLDEPARPPADQPSGDRGVDRGNHDPHGLAGPRRAGPRPLPAGGLSARRGVGGGAACAARVPRRVELHHSTGGVDHHRRQDNPGSPTTMSSREDRTRCPHPTTTRPRTMTGTSTTSTATVPTGMSTPRACLGGSRSCSPPTATTPPSRSTTS